MQDRSGVQVEGCCLPPYSPTEYDVFPGRRAAGVRVRTVIHVLQL